jgi:hypothetical protein
MVLPTLAHPRRQAGHALDCPFSSSLPPAGGRSLPKLCSRSPSRALRAAGRETGRPCRTVGMVAFGLWSCRPGGLLLARADAQCARTAWRIQPGKAPHSACRATCPPSAGHCARLFGSRSSCSLLTPPGMRSSVALGGTWCAFRLRPCCTTCQLRSQQSRPNSLAPGTEVPTCGSAF